MISLTIDPTLTYPGAEDSFSPGERFPEYRFEHLSARPNPVYKAVRDCLAQAGLDREHLGTADWNPLGVFVPRGSHVFVLCNFVLHRSPDQNDEDFAARCTHGSVLRALVDYLLLAVDDGGQVRFGNAPLARCHWESVLRETGAQAVLDFYHANQVPVTAKDLRLLVAERSHLGTFTRIERRPESEGVEVRMGTDSLLAELDRSPRTRYRIIDYNSRRTEGFHAGGSHHYVINREVLDSDVVVSLPKLKTHARAGMTCVLKGFVGSVGHKDSLPHHRFGSPEVGGDEYPSDPSGLLRLASALHDHIQWTAPEDALGNLLRVPDKVVRRLVAKRTPVTEGEWWGNDTIWRMILDLARIVTYATSDGELHETAVRKHLALIDGVIGGEGQGPLSPKPVHTGALLFADNPLAADHAGALLMGFDPQRLAMLREAYRLTSYPLITHNIDTEQVICNARSLAMSDLPSLGGQRYRPAAGWAGRLEMRAAGSERSGT